MSKNPYAKKYRASRTITYLKDSTHDQLEQLKYNMRLKSINDVIDTILEIQQDLREKDLIKTETICEECGKEIDAKMSDYAGITHQKIDSNSNCFGCITTKYRVKIVTKMLPGTIKVKDDKSEATEQKAEQSETMEQAITNF